MRRTKKRRGGVGFQVKRGSAGSYPPNEQHWVGSKDNDLVDPFAGTLDGCLSVALYPLTPEDIKFQQLRQTAINKGFISTGNFNIEYKPEQARFWIELKGTEVL